MTISATKEHGIHYTPRPLADFLARSLADHLPSRRVPLAVLDPACGDGALLAAMCRTLSPGRLQQTRIIGYETDRGALDTARRTLSQLTRVPCEWHCRDFLEADMKSQSAGQNLSAAPPQPCNMVIANPPYVRTQVLGADKAQRLGRQYGLQGRVDLYQAFTSAMANALSVGGRLGLLTSNRFLSTNSGESLRELLQTQFQLLSIVDLGDTKLFPSAAVLPAIVIAKKRKSTSSATQSCSFARVYERRSRVDETNPSKPCESLLDALRDPGIRGNVCTNGKQYVIEKGRLGRSGDRAVWTLTTPQQLTWLRTVHEHTVHTFGQLVHVRVGIKTTADDVFLRNWNQLPLSQKPESKLLKPLLTHQDAGRWMQRVQEPLRRVLYPHHMWRGKRRPIELNKFPRAKLYLESYRKRLSRRRYLQKAKREWYEIWVPQQPDQWSQPKIVYPDISEDSRFFLDNTGAIVNGDCYWMTLRSGVDPDWLLWILAVANSSLISRYYDALFHNKLYAGRRRFMTQYVTQFPVPRHDSRTAQAAIRRVKKIVTQQKLSSRLDEEIDHFVWKAFGVERAQ